MAEERKPMSGIKGAGKVWHKGPPPEANKWYPASFTDNLETVRWWNGVYWGLPAYKWEDMAEVRHRANKPSSFQDQIEWRTRPKDWP
jgi:hypothetical protein